MRLIVGTLMLLLAACDGTPRRDQVAVEEAWVQLPVVPGRPGAAYFKLRSTGATGRLVAIRSPRVERIELHETVTTNGIARMGPLQNAAFNEDGEIEFAPGGKHAMLFGIDPEATVGSRISLTFNIEPAGEVTADVEVRAFGEGHGGD